MSAQGVGACCCARRVGPGPPDDVSRPVGNVVLVVENSGGFDAFPSHSSHGRLLSSTSVFIFLLCLACISCYHIFLLT